MLGDLKFRDLGVEVDVDECTTVDAEDFLKQILVVATYTYGDGRLQMRSDFYENLAGLDLKTSFTVW